MQRKLPPFRNYVLRAFRFALHRIRVIERIAALDCPAPADQEAHLSSNILFGVVASITMLASRSASHCNLKVKKKNEDVIENNLKFTHFIKLTIHFYRDFYTLFYFFLIIDVKRSV